MPYATLEEVWGKNYNSNFKKDKKRKNKELKNNNLDRHNIIDNDKIQNKDKELEQFYNNLNYDDNENMEQFENFQDYNNPSITDQQLPIIQGLDDNNYEVLNNNYKPNILEEQNEVTNEVRNDIDRLTYLEEKLNLIIDKLDNPDSHNENNENNLNDIILFIIFGILFIIILDMLFRFAHKINPHSNNL